MCSIFEIIFGFRGPLAGYGEYFIIQVEHKAPYPRVTPVG